MRLEHRRLPRLAAGMVLAAAVVLGPGVRAGAGELDEPMGELCYYDIIEIKADGMAVLEDVPECFGSTVELVGSLDLDGQSKRSDELDTNGESAAMSGITWHYYTMSPLTGFAVSMPCNGSWMNLPAAYVNDVEATQSPCYVGHYNLNNLTGFMETSSPSSVYVLAPLNQNRTNSTQYLP